MIKEALEWINNEITDPKAFQSEGVSYLTKSATKVQFPKAACLEVNTLQAVIDYIDTKEFGDFEKVYIHIVDHATVRVIGALETNKHLGRQTYLEATTGIYACPFKFGKRHNREQFTIELMTKFLESENRAKVLQTVGNIKAEKIKNEVDDGISQVVTKKNGALAEQMRVENPVMLAPIRSFREIEQVESPFVLRFHQYDDEIPEIALYEADGSEWKIVAIERIKKFFKDNKITSKMTIIA